MLEEWGAPGAIKGDVLMGSQVVRKFGRSYQMDIMSGQWSTCSIPTKCGPWNAIYFDLMTFVYTYSFHKIECFLCSP